MKKKIIPFLLSILPFIGMQAQTTLSANQILDKTVSKIASAKGNEVNFKIYNSGNSGSGSIYSSGNKFNVVLPDAQVWYNGRDLYTYNKRAKETTVVTPTEEELAESNPLAYVTGAKNRYNITFSTVKKEGRYVLELTPKHKSAEIKRVTLTISKKDFLPEKIVVEPAKGTPISADITGFKTGVALQSSRFEYPASSFPKTELIDLR